MLTIYSNSTWTRRPSLGHPFVDFQSWLAQGEKVPGQCNSTTVYSTYGVDQMHMILNAIYPIVIFLVKTAILLLYIRVLGTCDRTKNGAMGLIVFVGLYCFAACLGTVFACTPRKEIWDVTSQGGRCIDIKTLVVAVAALNVASDILIILLPMPLVWYFLRVPRRQKIALTAVFMTGSL